MPVTIIDSNVRYVPMSCQMHTIHTLAHATYTLNGQPMMSTDE